MRVQLRYLPGTLLLAALLAGCSSAPVGAPTPAQPSAPPAEVTVGSTMTDGLRAPWGLATTAAGAHLVSERDSGVIWHIDDSGQRRELGVVPGVMAEGEGGLLGLALDPDGAGDEVYAYVTTEVDNRVVRISIEGDGSDGAGLGAIEPIVTGIPRASIHNGGRIAFGPDGMLYIATGDAAAPELAQDPASLAGKVLRVTPQGRIPDDNPFAGSMVYTLGHRNVQGLAFDDSGKLWASEFGTSVADELNVLTPGGNYGWPIFEGTAGQTPYIDPVAQWSPTSLASPSGIAFIGGDSPAIYVASLRGKVLWQVPVVGDRAGEPRALDLGPLGRLRTVIADGDGLLLMTSNTDGRGEPGPTDDVLLELRVTP